MAEKNKKIVIVEDSKDYLLVITENLTKEGFSVVTAEDGEEGLKVILEEKPDLILSDISMPKMDGIEMSKKLREAGVKTAIMFLTNLNDLKHISDAIEVSANTDYVIKSDITVEGIIERVKEKFVAKI
jgi:DNA-binding response OmpR family regulator